MSEPQPKVHLNYATCIEFLNAIRVATDTDDRSVNILALEGATPASELEGLVRLNPNEPDLYNDCVGLIWYDKHGEHIALFKATTEPGKFYTETSHRHPLGAANLVWGQHLYKLGKHRGHDALVSVSGFDRVWRDRDKDYTQDISERVYIGRFGIHVHAGGTDSTIGRWSAGCIAIHGGYEGKPYLEFLEKVKQHPERIIRLTLWGADDLARWNRDKIQWRPTLWYGMQNSWIAQMQRLLKSWVGLPQIVDGDWRAKTQEAFDLFCESHQIPKSAQITQEIWTLLEEKA